MELSDYLIDHSTIDWATVLRDWKWLLPKRFTVWLMNRFGDLFIVLDDGSIHMLEVGGGTLERVANDRDEFATLIDEGDNANLWLMIPLIDDLVAAGMTLPDGKCYGYRLSPVLGGEYTVANSFVISIAEHFSFHAYLHQQIKDLPDGAQVVLTFPDAETTED